MPFAPVPEELQQRCDEGRDLRTKSFRSACYAPFGTFELDPLGFVLPCCMNNAYPLGNVTEERLTDIWRGRRAAMLREALEHYDFAYGCGTCRWEAEHAKEAPQFKQYDRLPAEDRELPWPTEIGFCLSNTCNLECVHCNGLYSSRIRARIEKRPPIPTVYGDEFFEDLRAFLPHLRTARFVGGEPFMMRENHRVWDLLIEQGLAPECHVTTNGTQWNAKVERVLEHLPVHLIVSMDSAHKEQFEAIRRNADFDTVVANLDRFRAYADGAGTSVVVNHCLMRDNWREFPDMLGFAEERGLDLSTSTVFNEPFSLYKAPLDELREVVETMEERTDDVVAALPRNGHVWRSELAQLRAALDEREAGGEGSILAGVVDDAPGLVPDADEAAAVRAAPGAPRRVLLRSRAQRQARQGLVDELRTWAGDRVAVLELDAGGTVRSFEALEGSFYGLDAGNVVGRHLDDGIDALRRRLGPSLFVMDRHTTGGRFEVLFGYTSSGPYEKNGTFFRLVALPAEAGDGWTVVLASDEIYPPVPVDDPRGGVPFDPALVSPVPPSANASA
ncbi:MAG: radical SAM protein [Acidimicrobiales bacterium]|nr:radical SAM protein [Acidimicrobiales bacterium]MCB1015616.1 radical SAM protein [Acidimicrobiales bacterium]MCB9373357.1 radical SAM protein [Microthrixaceae bacterium]